MPHILTLTMNPAVDIAMSTDHVAPTHKLRCSTPQRHPGGGGINVARVIQRLQGDCVALYPAGGASGALFNNLLASERVTRLCIPIAGETRESYTVRENATGKEYRFVLPGPELARSEWQACLDQVAKITPRPRFLVASGSLPPGVPSDFYAQLARLSKSLGIQLILDTSGEPLSAALEEGVFMLKPSLRELRELLGQTLDTEQSQREAVENMLNKQQAQLVALSMGADGAWLFNAQGACYAPALSVTVMSAVGAGDSFVGAMAWALAQGLTEREAFGWGVAAGSAALASEGTGLCEVQEVERLHGLVQLQCSDRGPELGKEPGSEGR